MKKVLNSVHDGVQIIRRRSVAPVCSRATAVENSEQHFLVLGTDVTIDLERFELLAKIADVANFVADNHVNQSSSSHERQSMAPGIQ